MSGIEPGQLGPDLSTLTILLTILPHLKKNKLRHFNLTAQRLSARFKILRLRVRMKMPEMSLTRWIQLNEFIGGEVNKINQK